MSPGKLITQGIDEGLVIVHFAPLLAGRTPLGHARHEFQEIRNRGIRNIDSKPTGNMFGKLRTYRFAIRKCRCILANRASQDRELLWRESPPVVILLSKRLDERVLIQSSDPIHHPESPLNKFWIRLLAARNRVASKS